MHIFKVYKYIEEKRNGKDSFFLIGSVIEYVIWFQLLVFFLLAQAIQA